MLSALKPAAGEQTFQALSLLDNACWRKEAASAKVVAYGTASANHWLTE
jgi:hypothetical protein